jgi:hypothetical protein
MDVVKSIGSSVSVIFTAAIRLVPSVTMKREPIMYPADQAMMDSHITEDHLLFSFLYFIRQEDDGATHVDVDAPI